MGTNEPRLHPLTLLTIAKEKQNALDQYLPSELYRRPAHQTTRYDPTQRRVLPRTTIGTGELGIPSALP
jgi:hypothetical protein